MIIEREPSDQLPKDISEKTAEELGMIYRESLVSSDERKERYGQKPVTLWITGLISSGKMSLSYALEKRLFDLGASCVVLDGKNMRIGLNQDLSFDAEGRTEHLRRVAEVAKMLNSSGMIVIAGFVSPTAEIRRQVSEIIGKEKFLEMYIDSPLEWCEKRDSTGLYAKARKGEVKNIAGIDIPYEPSENPALKLSMDKITAEEAVEKVIKLLREQNLFPA